MSVRFKLIKFVIDAWFLNLACKLKKNTGEIVRIWIFDENRKKMYLSQFWSWKLSRGLVKINI